LTKVNGRLIVVNVKLTWTLRGGTTDGQEKGQEGQEEEEVSALR
jgi:hypothetical protein